MKVLNKIILLIATLATLVIVLVITISIFEDDINEFIANKEDSVVEIEEELEQELEESELVVVDNNNPTDIEIVLDNTINEDYIYMKNMVDIEQYVKDNVKDKFSDVKIIDLVLKENNLVFASFVVTMLDSENTEMVYLDIKGFDSEGKILKKDLDLAIENLNVTVIKDAETEMAEPNESIQN